MNQPHIDSIESPFIMFSLQDEMHQQLDTFFNSLCNPWSSPLLFDLHIGNDCATTSETSLLEICDFLSDTNLPASAITSQFAYFDRKKYPPPNPSTPILDKFAVLRQDLETAAMKAGFQLVSNGRPFLQSRLDNMQSPAGTTHPTACVCFTCNKTRPHKKRKNQTLPM